MKDSFEEHLSKLQRTEVPSHWREEILTQALRERSNSTIFAQEAGNFWTRFFGPHPLAWGSLAALWVLIAVLNFAGPHDAQLYAFSGPAPTLQELTLQLQTTLLAQGR